MNFPGVIAADPGVIEKIVAAQAQDVYKRQEEVRSRF